MTGLKRGVANHNQVLQSDNYVNADTNKKNDYNNAYNHANDIINGNAQHPVITPSDVNNALSNVTSKEHALNGEAKLNTAKQEANTALGQLNNLNNAQRQNLQSQINGAHQIETVNTIKQNATNLNSAMGNLRHAVADKDQVKRTEDYADADTAKQNAYNSAVSSAETIINQTANPTMSVDDVNRATSAVTTNKNALNGDEKLAQSKTDAARAIDALSHLNNAQKADVKSKINAASNIAGVNTVKQQGTDLNTAMGNLQGAINDEQTTLNSQNYQDATPSKKTAYTNAVQAAKDILNKSNGQNKTKDQVTEAMNQVNSAKTNLDGTRLLDQAKQTAKQQLNNMTHLTTAQKTNLTNQINSGTTVAGVHTVQSKANTLDQAMERLINGIQDKDQVKQSVNFTDADPEKQTAYNNAVTAAENIINQANGTNANQSQVEAALSTVTTTKQALNGDRKVTDAKNNANQTLSTLDNLNNAQKGAVTGNINQAHTVAEVTQAVQTAQELNTAMGNLKNSLNDKDTTLGSQNFADADPEKKNAYNEAVRNAENILNKSTGTNVPKDQVEAAMNQVNTKKAALNGTQNLEKAKQHANTAIDGLSHLTNAQKDALKQLVQQSTTVAEAQGNEQKANNVDAAMDKLRQSIADNATTKQNQNYTDARSNKKDAYNNAVTTAQGIIDQTTSPTLDPTVTNQAAGQVSTTKNALNGNENLEAAKQQATQSFGSLDNLNNVQKQAVTNQINGAHTVDEANQIKQNAQNLNTAMGNLKQEIADKDATKATVNFTDADRAKQQAYNTAVTNAENIISKANGGNATQTEVEQAIQQVNAAKQALNGNANVQHAKDEATALINSSNDLNQAQKDALKQQVQNATTVAGVNDVKQTAQELNNAMTQLKQGIADKEQTKADGNFVNADPDKQNAYNQAVAKAEALISGTPDVVVTPSEITAALNKVTQAKNDLNGNTNLATAKQNVQQAIDQLSNLNQAQRDEYNKQITQATLVPNVNAIQQAATTLNDAMTQLKQGIANKAQIKGSENYHDADTDKQTAYDNAVTKAEELLKQTTNPTMDPNTIQQALTKVNDTNQALNGNQKLADAKQVAKTNLGTLNHLNDAQKQALTTQVEQAPDIATVNNVKQNAYNKAVAHAEQIISGTPNANVDPQQVAQALQQVTQAKGDLNGNHNLQVAKDNANTAIDQLPNLNQPQKTALKDQVSHAELVTDVTTINQKAQALDHAMELLRNSIADNQATLASEDYHDATAQRQNDYNQAVTAAKNIINQTTSPTMNPDEVNRATTQVNNTKVALDGDENLAAAKQQANNRLNQLDHLNNAQKQQLQSQITQSSDIATVNGHKQTAESLNTAMGNLINAIADHQAVEQRGNFINADTDKQTAYTTAVNEAEALINKQTGQNANQSEVEQAITKVQTTLQALNGDHNLQVAKTNATQAIDALASLNDPQKTALKDQVTAATLVTAVHQIEQNANTLNQAMHGLRESIQDNAATKANSKYINEDQPEQQNYDQAVQAANNIINEQTATLDNNAINQAATTVNTTKAALHGDVKLQNDKDHAKQTVSQLAHLNNAQKHMEDTLIDSETTRTAVKQDLTEAQALDQLMNTLQQSIADKDATRASSAYVNAEPNKKQAYDEAVQNAESIIAGLNNPTINKGMYQVRHKQ